MHIFQQFSLFPFLNDNFQSDVFVWTNAGFPFSISILFGICNNNFYNQTKFLLNSN